MRYKDQSWQCSSQQQKLQMTPEKVVLSKTQESQRAKLFEPGTESDHLLCGRSVAIMASVFGSKIGGEMAHDSTISGKGKHHSRI